MPDHKFVPTSQPELGPVGWTAVEFVTDDDGVSRRYVLLGQRDQAGDAQYATLSGNVDGADTSVQHTAEQGDVHHLSSWVSQFAVRRAGLMFVGRANEPIDLTSAQACAAAIDEERRAQFECLQPPDQIMQDIEAADIEANSVTLTLEDPWTAGTRRRALILVLGVLRCEVALTLTSVEATVPPSVARWAFDVWQAD